MREFKGDWKDLFNGFTLALDLRKMFLAFTGLLTTVLICGAFTYFFARNIPTSPDVTLPENFAPHAIYGAFSRAWSVIFDAPSAKAWHGIVYVVVIVPVFLGIWALFGGAIARIAAYEIARDGERIEMRKAFAFSWNKFSSFFMAPIICILGLLFFFLCNLIGGALSKGLDVALVGGPLGAILLPLALLSGFIMLLIVIGASIGSPLFLPAVAAEGTDSFDAMSRGFSYVYSRPWHFAWYQAVTAVYGWICVTFVICFTVAMCSLGVHAAAKGWDLVGRLYRDENAFGMNVKDPRTKRIAEEVRKQAAEEKIPSQRAKKEAHAAELEVKTRRGDSRLQQVSERAWSMLLSRDHTAPPETWHPLFILMHPHRATAYLANASAGGCPCSEPNPAGVNLDRALRDPKTELHWEGAYHVTYWIVFAWLLIAVGMAWGYAVAYVISQQTVIYFVLRKKVDGIEMNEVFEEPEDEGPLPEVKPADPAKPAEGAPPAK